MVHHHDHQPEFDTTTFFREIEQPNSLVGPISGDDYRFYRVNREYEGEGRPLVVYNGFGSTPNTTLGQLYLMTYARHIQRPIIAPMNIHPSSAFRREEFATAHARALQEITDEPVDMTGMSWGGVLSYSVAEKLDGQVNHLVTASSVGTQKNLRGYAKGVARLLLHESRNVGKSLADAVHEKDIIENVKHTTPSLDRLDKIRRTRLLAQRSFQYLPDTLHPETSWHDIIGEHDTLTNPEEHRATVRRRNEHHPGSSAVSIVLNHGHLWAHMRPSLAQLVAESLERDQRGEYDAETYYRTRSDFSGVDPVPPSNDSDK